MFKKIFIAASIVAAALTTQAPAQAGGISISIGGGHGFHGGVAFKKGFHHRHRFHHRKRKFHHGGHRFHHRPHIVKKKFVKPVYVPKNKHLVKKRHVVKKHHVAKKHYVAKRHHLTNREIRRHLRHQGLYNIRFIDRHHGVAKVVAHNTRGYIGRYRVSTRNGHILSGRKVRNLRHYH